MHLTDIEPATISLIYSSFGYLLIDIASLAAPAYNGVSGGCGINGRLTVDGEEAMFVDMC